MKIEIALVDNERQVTKGDCMGVNIGEIQARRASRKKDREETVPDDYYANPHHSESSRHLVTEDKARDGVNPLAPVMRGNGDVDIETSLGKIERLMNDADQGKFLGFGKDGKLDGKEISEALEKLTKEGGVNIPKDILASLNGISEDKDIRIDIKESIADARALLATMDKNHDGGISVKEMYGKISDQNVER